MLFQNQWLGILIVLIPAVNCSVLRSSFLAVNALNSTKIFSQTSQNATTADESAILPEDTTLDGDWLENADRRNLTLRPLNALSLTTSTAGSARYSCDGRAFGRNLNLQSCIEAMDSMTDDHSPRTYGERGPDRHDVNLPYRFLSPDGLCAIDISHRQGIGFDTMIPADMKSNVEALIGICVRSSPNEGGIVSNLGENGGLAVRVTPYRPKVQCGRRGTAPPILSCHGILDLMPTNGLQQRFGRVDDPSAQVIVPRRFTGSTRRCIFTVDTIAHTDVGDWYKLWAAAVAVQVMCVEASDAGGLAYHLGELLLMIDSDQSAPWPQASFGSDSYITDVALYV